MEVPLDTRGRHKERVQRHFDRWSGSYDHGHITRWLRNFQERTIESMDPAADDYVLDVGCGTGWAVLRLAERLPGGGAFGIDLSPGMIREAEVQGSGRNNVEFTVADAENIPYADDFFAAVMCSSSFHHYPNPVRALREFARVLRPGGRAYILDPCRDHSLLIRLLDLGHKLFVRDHVRYYHTAEIKGFFAAAGFEDIREEFRVKQLFLNGKVVTSEALISARTPSRS